MKIIATGHRCSKTFGRMSRLPSIVFMSFAASLPAWAQEIHRASSVYTLPPDKLDKAIHLSRAHTALYFGDVAWTILILWLLIRSGIGARIRNWAVSTTDKAWLQSFLVAPAWLLLLSLAGLPIGAISHTVQVHYGLSVQHWPSWLRDWGLATLLSLVFGSIVLSVLYALMRHSPRRWWLWFWVLTLPAEVFVMFAIPIVIDPLFNHFEPLAKQNPALVNQLERVVKRGGMDIPPSRMYVMDASAKSTGVNAYVTGFGASKRVVVWDNTLKLISPDEILFIYGHEQGHYVLHHIVKGLILTAALTFIFYWIAYRLLLWIARSNAKPVADWSSMGWVLLLVTVLSFVAEPMGNAFSRGIEHEADVYGQEVIHGLVADPQQIATQDFQRLGEIWLEDPAPNPFVVWWTYSHPSVSARKRFAAGYDPWSAEQKPQYFNK
jgi:STE24 endopeptidase